MYLFSRSVRLAPGNVEKSLAWSFKITEKVNQIAEPEVSLWTTVFSARSGRLVWTSIVEDLVTLETVEAKLLADSGYLALVEEGAKFGSDEGVDDNLVQMLFPDPRAAEVTAQYATTIQATLAPGGMTRGAELGVDIAQRAGKITGCPTSFAMAATGTYGAVEWITVYESIEQLQKAQETLALDSDFTKLIDLEASKVYLTGAQQTAFRKIC